jgi:hypothetical protein
VSVKKRRSFQQKFQNAHNTHFFMGIMGIIH